MRDTIALRRYLQRHAEPDLPAHTFGRPYWHRVLVVPAYREEPSLLRRLARVPASEGSTLIILAVNRPESDSDTLANAALRDALTQAGLPLAMRGSVQVHCLNAHTDLYLYDMELLRGTTPRSQGIGLVRKTACDLALQWMTGGGISGHWLCSTDADALLPQDYFAQLHSAPPDAVAAVFPFRHVPDMNDACNAATALYELRLHQYVLGLEYAGSPYAFHTLGSAMAVKFGAYTHAHGFPRRAGAEDFYLLNKLAKLGPVARLRGRCIELQSRPSSRVPFGTGPSVAAIMAAHQLDATPLYYHPQCFSALAALLAALPNLAVLPERDLASLLSGTGDRDGTSGRHRVAPALAHKAAAVLSRLGIAATLDHCRRHASSSAQFVRQFNQWFDGFRTLKFIHALRDDGLPMCSLAELDELAPPLWPRFSCNRGPQATESAFASARVESVRRAVRRHWRWR